MKVSILLADKGTANPPAGTLNLLNVGWVQTQLNNAPAVPGGMITPSHAVAVFFEVEHQRCNHPIELVLELLDEDGQPVTVPGPQGPQQIRVSNFLTVASPAAAPIGASGTGNALIEIIPGLPLAPGSYRWNASLDGEHLADWFAAFRVLPPAQAPNIVFGAPPA
jgi:hypothetical protein